MTPMHAVIAMTISGLAIAEPVEAASQRPGRSNDGDPWALGYAVQVSRSCPGWDVEPQSTLAARGIIPAGRANATTQAANGPFQRHYYRGLADAEADHRKRPEFCRDVRVAAGSRWGRLARIFRPQAASPSR